MARFQAGTPRVPHAEGRRQTAVETPAQLGEHPGGSLLWPPDYPLDARHGRNRLSPEASADLDIRPLVQALSGQQQARESFVTGVLTELCTDTKVIAYRADTVTNLLEQPALRQGLVDLLPRLSSLVRERERPMFGYEWNVEQIVHRLEELDLYVEAALGLAQALEPSALQAPALQALRTSIQTLISTAEFQTLRQELPTLRAQFDQVQSITIGVNLSRDFRPESATILSVDTERVEGRGGFLERLLGRESARRGMTKLRGQPGTSLRAFFPPMEPDHHGHHNALVDDLRRLLERIAAPVAEAMQQYVWVHTRDFAALEAELSFMLNAAALIERLRASGLPMCRPEMASIDERVCHLEESYNVSLALRMMHGTFSARKSEIVTNPISFGGEHARVWILTGPNRGGKTTYARAVGLAHLLLQTGLYVPASAARMSPIDALYTHFPRPESTTLGEGRLDEEALRLAAIFRKATPHSLILLNEGLSGTSTLEALALAHDAVRGLRLLGARTIYVTHLHELARSVDQINASTCGDGTVGSLVAEVEADPDLRVQGGDGEEPGHGEARHRRTFRIRPGPPLGLSYASEIAEQHGISYAQLLQLLQDRGLIGD